MLLTWSRAVSGDVHVVQSRRKYLKKSHASSSFSPSLMKSSKAISRFLPTIVGGCDGSFSFGIQDRLISLGRCMTRDALYASNPMTDIGECLVSNALRSS